MQRIYQPSLPQPMPNQPRGNAIRFGKWLYLILLVVGFGSALHVFLKQYYVLSGEGFVTSEVITIALPVDAQFTQLVVEEGQTVATHQLLAEYDSIEVRQLLNQYQARLSELQERHAKTALRLNQARSELVAASEYAQFTQNIYNSLKSLNTQDFVSSTDMSVEARRHFDAKKAVSHLESDLNTHQLSLQTIDVLVQRTQAQFNHLGQWFKDGKITAPANGVIAKRLVTPGQVLTKGDTAMQLYHGKRYITAYFDDSSIVKFSEGSKILVGLPNSKGYSKGHIVRILPLSHPAPEEFQPKFKPKQRFQLAVVELPSELLADVPLLSKVTLHKPLFF